jgi:RecA/RadA recombinase
MANPLLELLRKNDKHGLFRSSDTSISYETGFAPFDYRNGYMVKVIDIHEKLVESYSSTGLVGGTYTTIIGKSGTAKTTFAVQVAANIVKKFPSGMVIHYDLEQALNYTRIKNITGLSQADLIDKYVLRQEKNPIESIYESILEIAHTKENNKKDFQYATGLFNEFGNPIISFVPTFIIIDSLPSLSSRDVSKEEIQGLTYRGRLAIIVGEFYRKLGPMLKAYNINVVAINHITTKVEINPFAKSQPQLMYLKMDESVPAGMAPIYLAHQFMKFVSCGKYTTADDGFDGFKIRCELIKSRSNKAGQFCHLVYNQDRGFDPIATLYDFADENGLLDGRNPYKYFKEYKDLKFDSRKFTQECQSNPNLQRLLNDMTLPILQKQLSDVDAVTPLTEEEVLMRMGVVESQDAA